MAKPEIRIKGYGDEWKPKVLSSIAKFSKGHGYSKSDLCEQGTPIILYGRLYTNYSTEIHTVDTYVKEKKCSFFSKGGEIIIPASGETPEDIACASVVKNGGVILGGDLNVLNLIDEECDPSFTALSISYGRVHGELAKYAQGKTVVHLHNTEISRVSIKYPQDVKEQKTIVEFFNSLDSTIQGLTNKVASLRQLKQACLISMFPQEGETVPRVRFKGFEKKWSTKKLDSIANRVTRKNSKLESLLPLTISSLDGLIEQTEFFNHVVASSNLKGYYLMKRGEFAYNKSYSNGFPFGSIKRLDRFDMGALSTLYIVFSLKDNISSDYVVSFFETNLWHREVSKRAAEGARNHGLLNISADDFLDIDILVPPTVDEQNKVANYFKIIDSQIKMQSLRLEKLKQIKSACLNKMFV